jgi:CHAD domain-containing protein
LRSQAYIDTVATSWDAIKDWNFKTLKRYHNDVHDVRKEIRAINYTSDFFPEVFKNQEHAQELKLALRQFYDVYSKVRNSPACT